jgi:SAM-dependent methyltransferase
MNAMERKEHWENIYTSKSPLDVSWYQTHADRSLALIQKTGVERASRIIDVGGGASTLVDDLIDKGYEAITVLDVSSAGLAHAKSRLGDRAAQVEWIVADATQANLPSNHYDLWHDRAVFHFLTQAEDRARYNQALRQAVRPGGHVVLSTFALDGPPKCSGLEIVRYSPESLLAELGPGMELIERSSVLHQTPFGTQQIFIYCWFRKT